MMQGDFTLGKVGEYTPQNVEENTFLNDKLENDTYGIYYSVKFEGDAETYLIQAKKAPVEGQPEWGMLEQSKSGKSIRFKRVKREEPGTSSSVPHVDKAYLKDASTIPMDVYRVIANIRGLPENADDAAKFWEIVRSHSEELLSLIDNVRSGDKTPTESTGIDKARMTAANIKAKQEFNEPDIPDFGDE